MTDLAISCVTPLFRCPQGSQGCLEKWNHPLSSNLAVCCAKIGPKTKKVQKTSELTKKYVKNDGFSTVFLSILVLGPILAHQTTKFKLSGQFCFSIHPWGPWGHLSSGVIWNETKISWSSHCDHSYWGRVSLRISPLMQWMAYCYCLTEYACRVKCVKGHIQIWPMLNAYLTSLSIIT